MATRTISNAGGNWSSTSAWTEGVVPTAADDVIATASSSSLTIDAAAACRSADFTNYTATLTHNSAVTWSIGTSTANGTLALKFVSAMTYVTMAGSSAITFVSTSATQLQITTAGKTLRNTTFNGIGGSWILLDALTLDSAASLNVSRGSLDINNQALSVGRFNSSGTNTRSVNLGSSTVTLLDNGTVWNFTSTGQTFSASTSTINIANTGSAPRSFSGGDFTYNDVNITAGGTGIVTIAGNNTFNTLTINAPKLVRFTAGTTQTMATFNATGFAGNIITIDSTTAGSAATLSKTSGTVSCNYLSLQDSAAIGGAAWYAGANSTNVSGNAGWIFTAPPGATSTHHFFNFFK